MVSLPVFNLVLQRLLNSCSDHCHLLPTWYLVVTRQIVSGPAFPRARSAGLLIVVVLAEIMESSWNITKLPIFHQSPSPIHLIDSVIMLRCAYGCLSRCLLFSKSRFCSSRFSCVRIMARNSFSVLIPVWESMRTLRYIYHSGIISFILKSCFSLRAAFTVSVRRCATVRHILHHTDNPCLVRIQAFP